MNKTITTMLVAIVLLAGIHSVSAATCDINNPCGGNGNPSLVVGGWGTTNSGVPAMTQGQVATDANGIHSTCQWMNGCVNVYQTPWYANIISIIKSQMSPSQFQHWINLQK